MTRRLPAAIALVLLAALSVEAASVYQPGLAFRVLATPHFRIYYHQGGEAQARRLARIAEAVRGDLAARTRLPAPAVTHVVLANQDDDPNGSATPLPYPTVRIAAAWPATSDLIANTDDWLRAVFIHEYAHILQLERTRGWATIARALLGRSPISFPNLFLPQWQVEGYATFWESELTGRGRLNGGDARSIVNSRARAGAMPLDQVNGGLVEWPGGNAQYLEGAWFFDYLTRRFGEDAVGQLSHVTAGRFLYLSSPAFKQVFHASLGDLWRGFQTELTAGSLPGSGATAAKTVRRLTTQGYWVSSPRFDPSGRHLVYFLRDPDGFPSVRQVDVEAGAEADGAPARVVADRFGGRVLSVRQGLVFFDEIEAMDNAAWRSDLRVADLESGRTQRLTNNGRLLEPDVSPDGRRVACVKVDDQGLRVLAFFEIEKEKHGRLSLSPAVLPIRPEPDATYGAPRWSPDGRRLAVEQRTLNGPSSIMVFDVADGTARVVASARNDRVASPTWMPGATEVLYASDRSGEFQVYVAELQTGRVRQVTAFAGGATFPDVSPDGTTLAFVGAGATGFDLYTSPIDREGWRDVVLDDSNRRGALAAVPSVSDERIELRRYSPVPTLLPRSWTPLADTADGAIRLGVGLTGTDVLARHAYSVSVLWRVTGDNGSGVGAARPDWSASYVYDRWRPAFFVSASDRTSFLDVAPAPGAAPLPAALREQDVTAGVALPIARVRHTQAWQAGFNAGVDTLSSGPLAARRDRRALRAAWAINSAKQYGRSISVEDGVAAAVTSEQVREAFGGDGNADAFTGEIRAYWRPGASHAVLAARAGYGVASGDASVRRRFFLGGSMPAGPLVNFGSDALRMLRGFDDRVSAGDHIGVASLEWRQPILRVERGWGTFPVFLRTIHATVFADAGHAWNADFRLADVKTSVGAEGAIDLVAGYWFRFVLTTGAAWTRDGAAGGRSGGAVYFRIGPSF